MYLQNLIQSVPSWQTKTPEQLLVALSDRSIVVEDNRLYTWAGVAAIAGDAGASALCAKLIEFGKLWAVHQLGGAGLDLSNEEIQQQLYFLDSVGVPGMIALAQTARKHVSPLEQAGLEATVEQVAEAVDVLMLEREWATVQNEVINPAISNRELLIAALRQAANQLEGD